MDNIHIIVIFYNPTNEIISLWQTLASITTNFKYCIVDNSIIPQKVFGSSNISYLPMKMNMGIATAQNVGIRHALKENANLIVFFDQDSIVNVEYINSIINEYNRIKKIVSNLAILGPTIVNKETMTDYKINTKSNSNGFAYTSHLISSGTIVEADTIRNVGMMEDRLFIDAVDFEWCWRAISKNYVCVRTENVRLPHKVGQKNKTILGIPFIVSSPFRYYFQYRNWLWMLRRSYVPRSWKLKSVVRRISEFFIVPFLSDKKIQTLTNICKGIKDGLIIK